MSKIKSLDMYAMSKALCAFSMSPRQSAILSWLEESNDGKSNYKRVKTAASIDEVAEIISSASWSFGGPSLIKQTLNLMDGK